ncbi:MutS-related protein [Mucilaginibacter paludis]|uniref:DNA mismatch repair protein MutS domain protein n=1 Tax=Mucilaginibacter paludis DSM 18603 TaxID=714943 RepID=H1YCD6_9SPHI|nr:DNA mismatch repair protein MutS [Mucilaginibacter paludis]EHQ30127.1 DNA mismatch repair protein MutS domain protein [Mucilaginibacter paludis DSM 18603]
MNFDIDRQTLNDLAIFPNNNSRQSVYELFNHTITIGGNQVLQDMFNNPLIDVAHIQERINVLLYIEEHNIQINLNRNDYDFAEFYLKKHYHARPFSVITQFIQKVIYAFKFNDDDYYVIQTGVKNILSIVDSLIKFTDTLHGDLPKKIQEFRSIILDTFQPEEFEWLQQLIKKRHRSATDMVKADHFFRQLANEQIKTLLKVAYHLDVYQSVSKSGKALGFTFPAVIETSTTALIIKGLFHPFIANAKSNDIEFSPDKNVCFVTGTNMAGKSSLLKSIGIAVYLSQLGFPVPAKSMVTSAFKGLITTINLADDLEQGHSHFYKEVLRVKHVAEKLNQSKNILVIFDELFRGTNVKDAYDASLAIITAFAEVRTSFFLVSTHIVEVAHELSSIQNINFRYMETIFEDTTPVNSYQLKEGITEERLGMWIVKNERILEIINNSLKA